MGAYPPPEGDITPRHALLPAGTVLWRVHHRNQQPNQFTDRPAHPYFGGGRFDGAADDPYPFLYAGATEPTALTEVLLRDIPFATDGYRILPRSGLRDRRLTALETTAELRMVTLETAQDLAAIGQTDWLVQAEPTEFAQTRFWARWLRTRSDGQGLLWQSRRNRPDRAFVFFGDRCGADAFKPLPARCVPLDTPEGIAYLNELLGVYRVRLDPDPAAR